MGGQIALALALDVFAHRHNAPITTMLKDIKIFGYTLVAPENLGLLVYAAKGLQARPDTLKLYSSFGQI